LVDDVRIRKVSCLNGIEMDLAIKQKLSDDDLVIVRTSVEKIEGDPLTYLLNKIEEEKNEGT
jgi:hypothetical protein